MTRHLRSALLALLTAATAWVAMISWRGFTTGVWHALVPLAVIGAAMALAGWALRLVRVPPHWVVLAQAVVGWMITAVVICGSVVPVYGGARQRLLDSLNTAYSTVQTAVVPVPVQHAVEPYLLLGGMLGFFLADVLAMTFRRPGLAGIALLAVLGVSFGMDGTDHHVAWWEAALVAAGFVGQLLLRQSESVDTWGRRLAGSPWLSPRSVRWSASLVGVGSTALAVAAAVVVPVAHVELSGFGPGNGDQVQVTDPLVGMRQELNQGKDEPLLVVHTRGPEPSYLRLSTLDDYNGNDWAASARHIPAAQTANGAPLPHPGIAPSIPRTYATQQIDVTDAFASHWLPTPYPAYSVDARGDWRYDRSTLDFLSVPSDLTTAGLHYTARAEYLRLTGPRLDDATFGAGAVPPIDTYLPTGVPALVTTLADRIVGRARVSTPFAEAVALQRWFRTPGRFAYDTHVVLGSDAAGTVRFLSAGQDGRRGFCQQFASAFALMARALGIPARVAVGFLTPTRTAPDTYVFSTHDAHAWPELYFPGAGWVRFEPTPAVRAAGVPDYTTGPLPVTNPGDGGSGAAHPSGSASAGPSAGPHPHHHHTPPTTGQAGHAHHASGTPWLIALGALVVATALLALPSLLRRRRRHRRLRGTPEDAWAEVRDTVTDLQLPWPTGRSPQEAGRRLRPFLDTDGRTALARVVDAVERERYAPMPGSLAVKEDATAVVVSLTGNASSRMKRRAAWWPSSLWS